MNTDPEPRFPADLSDEAATTLCDFLHELAAFADSHYLAQILRYRRLHQPSPFDPDRPWLSG